MKLKIQPITANYIPLVEMLAYDYNYELDPQETKKEAVHRWIASVSNESLARKNITKSVRTQTKMFRIPTYM